MTTVLRKLEARFGRNRAPQMARARADTKRVVLRSRAWLRLHPIARRVAVGTFGLAGLVVVVMAGVWWRLASGPISLDVATPWLVAAVEQNFGAQHKVEVGGTQIERDESGRASLRIRDIVVRDRDGSVVASAPKAEVALSGSGLMSGRVRAERLSLVGAAMSVRIEPDGNVTVFAGADSRPLATAKAPVATSTAPAPPTPSASAPAPAASTPSANAAGSLSGLLAWIDGLSASGLDGYELSELGLKNGSLAVDDQRKGKHWVFDHIDLSLTRPHGGGVVFKVSSDNATRPWSLTAAVAPTDGGRRLVQIEARKVSTKDIMLASRMSEPYVEADVPISARLRAEIDADGMPDTVEGKVIADAGEIVDPTDPESRLALDRAEFNIDWDAQRKSLSVPFQIVSGGNRLTLLAELDAPRPADPHWRLALSGGSVFLAPPAGSGEQALVLNRIALHLRCDPDRHLVAIEQAEIGNMDLGLAASGTFDYSGEPRLAVGLAGNRMSASAMKRLWPFFIQPEVRAWVEDHVLGGAIERLAIATNTPVKNLFPSGPPVPDEGLSIDIVASGATLRPLDTLPAIGDADLNVHITGHTATLNLSRGTIDLPSGRKMTIGSGVFEVADMTQRPVQSRTRFRLDGLVPAAAELLASDRLREFSGAPVDPNTSRGIFSAQVSVGLPLKTDLPKGTAEYSMAVDLTNFAADRMVMGQRLEATALKVLANNQGYQIKGDVKIAGTPANIDYRKGRGDGDADLRLQATLDEAARGRLGFDLGTGFSGNVPVKVAGRLGATGENRFAVDADLGPVKVDNLLPGWVKPAGKPAKASFTLTAKPQQSTRLDDIAIDGSGAVVKGSLELDSAGDLVTASFPVFTVSEGDKANIKADRASDGALRVTMRGDVYDGRVFVKTALGASTPERKPGKRQGDDIDLDVKLGTVAGFHGETVRGLDLRLSRRGGEIRSLTLNGKLGRDTPLSGDLRGRGRAAIYIETNDAGALFRFADIYSRMSGGQMNVAIDVPTSEQAPQDGILNVRDFYVRGEQALDKIVSGAPSSQRNGIEFSRMRVDFTRSQGKLTVRDGVVKGPTVGATIDGNIDYAANDVRMRGTFVPLYGLNNVFGQIPIVGMLLGGSNEGLVGITYEVIGTPASPVLRVNPISAIAPGLLRKIFEFPAGGRESTAPANRSSADPAAQ